MTDEMVVAQAQWLPQYKVKGESEKAKARLEAAVANGTRVKTMEGFTGMARLHTKTVEERQAQKKAARTNVRRRTRAK